MPGYVKVGPIKVRPIGFESLGVRSMATLIETPDVKVLVDPGVSLAPKRYGLPPAEQEWEALEKVRREITSAADKADVITISHYHYDHHTPFSERKYDACTPDDAIAVYDGKTILMKHPEENINKSQAGRAASLLKGLEDLDVDIEYADDRTFRFGDTVLEFSPPFPHGPEGTRLGYVLCLAVKHGDDTVVHASDVQGPVEKEALEWILDRSPRLVLISGPPLYLLGFRFPKAALESAVENMIEMAKNVETLLLDHHVVRQKGYREKLREVYEAGNVVSAADVLGTEETPLEAYRRELHEGEEAPWRRS